MPRCTSSAASPAWNSRYLLRRSTRSIVRPRMHASRSPGTGQRRRESYTSIRATRRPITCGAIPRRVVSTSGSSGILEYLRRRPSGAWRGARREVSRAVCERRDYSLIFRDAWCRVTGIPSMTLRFSLRAAFTAVALAVAASVPAWAAEAADEPAASRAPASGVELNADLFYRLLLGDVALQRGDLAVSARAYLDAARTTQDARLAERATEVSIAARDRTLVHDAADLWARLDPSAERPKHVLAALESNNNTGAIPSTASNDELRARIEHVLANAALTGPGVGDVFMQLNRLFSDQSDKRAVLALVREVAKPYPKTPEAHYAVAIAAFGVGADDAASVKEARDEADRALELRPTWERAVILKAEIVGRSSPQDALAVLEAFVAANPDAKSAAGALAQRYVDRKRYKEARALMQRLWDRDRESRDLEFAVATIALEMKDYPEASRLLEDLKS